MTYAVALNLESGMVFAADTRTNAGVDNISQFRKLHHWNRPGDRVLVLLTAGNLRGNAVRREPAQRADRGRAGPRDPHP